MKEKSRIRGVLDYVRARGKLPLLLGGALLGVLLLLLGGLGGEQKEPAEESDPMWARAIELQNYEKRIEKEIEELCEAAAGVSDAVVMVSFSRGYRILYTEDDHGAPVTVGSGSSEEGVFDSLAPPAVSGVGVVCRGGGRPEVQRALVELISTTLGIPANRVYVTGK